MLLPAFPARGRSPPIGVDEGPARGPVDVIVVVVVVVEVVLRVRGRLGAEPLLFKPRQAAVGAEHLGSGPELGRARVEGPMLLARGPFELDAVGVKGGKLLAFPALLPDDGVSESEVNEGQTAHVPDGEAAAGAGQ